MNIEERMEHLETTTSIYVVCYPMGYEAFSYFNSAKEYAEENGAFCIIRELYYIQKDKDKDTWRTTDVRVTDVILPDKEGRFL